MELFFFLSKILPIINIVVIKVLKGKLNKSDLIGQTMQI